MLYSFQKTVQPCGARIMSHTHNISDLINFSIDGTLRSIKNPNKNKEFKLKKQ